MSQTERVLIVGASGRAAAASALSTAALTVSSSCGRASNLGASITSPIAIFGPSVLSSTSWSRKVLPGSNASR